MVREAEHLPETQVRRVFVAPDRSWHERCSVWTNPRRPNGACYLTGLTLGATLDSWPAAGETCELAFMADINAFDLCNGRCSRRAS